MALLSRIWSFLRAPRAAEPAHRSPPTWREGWGHLGAVGESQYQPALRRVARAGRVCWATLVPESDNPFDPNAIAVQIAGETVAYLARRDARRYNRRLRAVAGPIEVPAKLIGGTWGKPSFGVLLDCRAVEQLPNPKPVRKKKVGVDAADQPF